MFVSIVSSKNICPDNRVPQKRNDGSWYHDSECNYNPYIAKWNGEVGFQTLSECGVISTADRFTVDL